jgi:carboxypeptidase PM20D1
MKWVKRIVFAILAILALFVGVVVVRTAMVRPEAGSASPVAPMLVLGGTDSRYYAPISENVYRFAPEWGLQSEYSRIHGTGERLSLENLGRMVRFFAQLVETGAR